MLFQQHFAQAPVAAGLNGAQLRQHQGHEDAARPESHHHRTRPVAGMEVGGRMADEPVPGVGGRAQVRVVRVRGQHRGFIGPEFRSALQQALGLPRRGCTVVREVILSVDGRPVSIARSIRDYDFPRKYVPIFVLYFEKIQPCSQAMPVKIK